MAREKSDKKSPVASETAKTVEASARGLLRTQDGVVVSDKMEKTVIVAVTRQVRHARYGKFLKKTERFYAHDEKNECGVGDLVRMVPTRPMSRHKHWRVYKVLAKAIG